MPTQDHTSAPSFPGRASARAALGLVLMSLLLTLPGCRCDDDRPYTPFQVASALPASDGQAPGAEPTPAASAEPAPTGLDKSALVLRTGGLPSEWEAFGRKLDAPKRTGFAGGVELPGASGQPSRLLAWALPKKEGRLADGGLYLIDERGRPARRVAALPDFLPSGPGCTLTLGALSATLVGVASTVRAECSGRLLPGTATGAFVLSSNQEPERPPFVLRLVEGPTSEPLTIEVEGTRSADGALVDLTTHLDLTAPSGAHARLPFRFVGKAGGLSRVADSPSTELEALTKELAALVPRKKEREVALQRVDATRRWVLSVCQEAGAPRILDEAGRPLSCGPVKGSLDRLTEAAIEAYLYRDEQWKAAGEFARADDFLGTVPAKTKERWAARMAEKGKIVRAEVVGEFPLRIGLDVAYPYASPLRYGKDGQLYGLSADGSVIRLGQAEVAPEAPPPLGEPGSPPPPSEAPSDAPAAWPLRPKSSDGRLLAALVPSCERAEIQMTFSSEGGEAAPATALTLLAPRPCRGLMGKPLPVEPIGWEGPALLAISAGEPTVSQGSLRVPERPLVWGSSLGLEVWSNAGYASWRGPALSSLHHCAPGPASSAEGPRRVACVRGKTAVEVARSD